MAHDADHLEYVSLTNAVVGHVTLAVPEAIVVFAILETVRWTTHGHELDVGALALMALLGCVVAAVCCTLAERPAVVRAQHPAPGGWGYAVWQFILPAVAGLVVGSVESRWWGIVCAGAVWLVNVAEALWMRPWKRGWSRAVVREKWEATKQMTDDMRLEDGWVGPAKEQRRHVRG